MAALVVYDLVEIFFSSPRIDPGVNFDFDFIPDSEMLSGLLVEIIDYAFIDVAFCFCLAVFCIGNLGYRYIIIYTILTYTILTCVSILDPNWIQVVYKSYTEDRCTDLTYTNLYYTILY